MKEHEYNPQLPHGMPLDAYMTASKYGIATAWNEYLEQFEDATLLPSGLLNHNGVELLNQARAMGWDHHNFFYYKKLKINWLMLASIHDLIRYTGIPPIQTDEEFIQPDITEAYIKPRTINEVVYQPINRHGTRLLETDTKVRKIKTVWDRTQRIDYDVSLFNWQGYGFPRDVPGFLSYDKLSRHISYDSTVTKQESPVEVLEILNKSELQQLLDQEIFLEDFRSLFSTLLLQHGLFIGMWYEDYFADKLVRHLLSLRLRSSHIESLFAKAYGYPGSINDIAGHIFWQLIFYSINNNYLNRSMQTWIQDFSKPKSCALCGEMFSPILVSPAYYFGSNGNSSICFGCIDPKTPPPGNLKLLVSEFVDACGFPPQDGVTPIDWRVNVKISHGDQLNVIKAWSAMGGIHHVKNTLNISWFKAMYDADCLPEGTVVSGRGIKCMAADGHECGSLDEKTIDDLLSANGIAHKKEPYYPSHRLLNPNRAKRADWKVGDIYIEYFGLAGNPKYDQRTFEKLQLAAENGLELISLFPSDVIDLDNSLIKKLL